MADHFDTTVSSRHIRISTKKVGHNWEMFFEGEEVDKAYENHEIYDPAINLWNAEDDPEGSEAEKIHLVAIQLLKRENMKFLEIYKRLEKLSGQVEELEKGIRFDINKALK